MAGLAATFGVAPPAFGQAAPAPVLTQSDLICRTVGHVSNLLGVDAKKQELFLDELALICQKHRVVFELEKLEKLQSKKRKFEEVDEQIAVNKEKLAA